MLIRYGGFVIKGNRGIGLFKTTFPNPYIVAAKGILQKRVKVSDDPLFLSEWRASDFVSNYSPIGKVRVDLGT